MRLFPARPAPIFCCPYRHYKISPKWCGARLAGFVVVGKFVSILLVLILFLFLPQNKIFAVDPPPPVDSAGNWVVDEEVTSVGKSAQRARQFLDWTLNPQNASWVFSNPQFGADRIGEFWKSIRDISYLLTLIIVLVSALLIIITRGQSINARKQILVVGGVLLLITLSFSIIQFVYGASDRLQEIFLKLPTGNFISSQDLLNIAFDYENFIGYRKEGINFQNDESARVSLFLVKATTITYYVMGAMLLIRKVILWFFIILSPLWVLLLPFPLIRNTAKIWMGEFFRWLFYGPIFAVLLAGLVKLWQENIPLNFNTAGGAKVYPTAISILLGGPGERVAYDNSVNNVDTYAKYLIALLMLWVVIFLPFLLLKIFRDALSSLLKEDNAFFQKAFGSIYPFLGRMPSPLPGPPPPPGTPPAQPPPPLSPPPAGEGLTQQLGLHRQTGLASEVTINAEVANIEALPKVRTEDIIKYAGLAVPRLQDLARMEIERNSLTKNQSMLRKISSPSTISTMHERSKFSSIQQELLTRAKRGDVKATTILAAAESARSGKPVSIVVGGRAAPGRPGAPITAAKPQLMPTVNRIQTVGIDDYEEVKKMWEENYRNGDIPISDKVKSRSEWIKQDLTKMETVIELLANTSEEKKKQGLEELAIILPFLLLGGFSDQETTVYLKAKLEGAKKVLVELEQKVGEEDKVLIENKKEAQAEKAMEAEAEIEKPENKKSDDSKSEVPGTNTGEN